MPLCVVCVSWWLLVSASGYGSPWLAHRDVTGFSTVSCLFGERWQEGTWDVGSLFKHSSPYTHTMSADGSWQGEDWGSPESRQGRDLGWPARPGSSRNRGSQRRPRVQHYFWPSLVQSLKGIPGPGPDGGLGTPMGNGLGLLVPSCRVLGTGLGGGRRLIQDKGLPGGLGQRPSWQRPRGACREAQPRILETQLLHLALPLADNPGQILCPLWASVYPPAK